MVKSASGNDAWQPDDPTRQDERADGRPMPDGEAGPLAIPTHPDGPIPGGYERDTEWHNDPLMPTGGVPSAAAGQRGPDADLADEEQRREAGGAPGERARGRRSTRGGRSKGRA
jgi:hypothetical protein